MQAAWRGALDMLFPPQALDGGPRPLAGGFSADRWSRIRFLDGPPTRASSPGDALAGIRSLAEIDRPIDLVEL